jgi:hypothetical protein
MFAVIMIWMKRALLIFLWIVFLWLPGYLTPGEISGQSEPPATFRPAGNTAEHRRLLLAENDEKAKKQELSDPTQNQEPEQKSNLKTGPETSVPKKEEAPLTPFVPSEEIKADQAVDFPYDI